MNLKNLTDLSLMQTTESYIREEREVLTNLLHHFREIERRRLFCEYQYGSLHKMLVGHFGYSDDEAYRRISAMRLLGEMPEVEEKINKGELSLSHLGLAQSFFKHEKKSLQADLPKESKLEILQKISEQPIREAQRIVYSLSSAPEQLRPDRVSIVSEDKIEFRFTADRMLESKVQDLKGLLAHKHPNLSMAELFEILCDLGLQELKQTKAPAAVKTVQASTVLNKLDKLNKIDAPAVAGKDITFATPRKECVSKPFALIKREIRTESVTKPFAQIKKEVWHDSEYKCSNCRSSYALELDHRYPKGKGGDDSKDNLRILCRSCNQRSAIRHYGSSKMEPYLNRHKTILFRSASGVGYDHEFSHSRSFIDFK